MKRYFWIFLGLFTLGVGVTIALRMTSDAMAVIVGIILGMVATLPTSLILLYMMRQQHNQQAAELRQQQHQVGQYPPVVVVNSQPGNGYGGMASANPQSFLPSPTGERSFKVVGQEASSTDSDRSFNINALWDEGV